MVVKVKGIGLAREVAQIMQDRTGEEAFPRRDPDDTRRVYWVSNTHLDPAGEQMVLDLLPPGTLLYCAGCSHQPKAWAWQPVPGTRRRRLSPRTTQRLTEILHEEAKLKAIRAKS